MSASHCFRVASLFVLWLPLAVSTLTAAEPAITRSDLFEAGKQGYELYRIPGLVVTRAGTLLAYCEARKSTRGDWGTIDIYLVRSSDGGRTWQPRQRMPQVSGPKEKNPVALAQKLAEPGDVTYNNPVAIVDRSGAVHFLFCLEYARCFYCRSDDDGVTWSAPVEITKTFDAWRSAYDWKVLATGPAHGIQLGSGRLVVPVWLSLGTGGHAHRPSVTATIYSDDLGATWKAGEIAVPNTKEWVNPNETVIVELDDGRVMLNVRSESSRHRRLVTTSADGAKSWSKPEFQDALVEPICMGSIARLSHVNGSTKNRLLFANPHNLARADGNEKPGVNRDRKNLSVKLSYDEGASWPIDKVLEPGYSGYSDLAVDRNGTIHCLFERGASDGKNATRTRYLTLASFNLEWLTDGRDTFGPDGTGGKQ